MRKDIKEEWIERLRSDEYEQLTGQLRDKDNGRCCLGVLCDIYADHRDDGYWNGLHFETESDSDADVLPREVWKWAGLTGYQGARITVNPSHLDEAEGKRRSKSLSQFNDGIDGARQHDFDEIADLIEDQL